MGASILESIRTPDDLSGALPVDAVMASAAGASNLAARGDHVHRWVDTGWQTPTLLNDWVVYDATYGSAAMYRRVGPIVFIRGLVRLGSWAIFVLPEGFRPAIRMLFGVDSDTGHGRLDVETNGTVSKQAGGNGYFQTSCYFMAAD